MIAIENDYEAFDAASLQSDASKSGPNRRRITVIACALILLAGGVAFGSKPQAARAEPALIGTSDLQYEGSFTVPDDGANEMDSLAYGGAGLAYNPANNSLFITGHDWHQRTAEIAIPQLGVSDNPGALPRASYIQTPVDATDGQLPDISNPRDEEYGRIGGYLVDGDTLIVSSYDYYDADNTQVRSHLATDTTLGASSPMVSLNPAVPARWIGGAMAEIPEAWRAEFGGDTYMTGLGGISIISNSSVGPAAATFSAETLSGGDPANLVLGYPLSNPLDAPEQQSALWNMTSEARGMVFPEGTSSVLYFGTHGVGPYCYGTGAECNDPVRSAKGTHAYPYVYQVWAYDAADLASVFRGEASPESLRPYDVWTLDLPFATADAEIGGAAYDPASGRIFITQGRAEGVLPVVHVYTVS